MQEMYEPPIIAKLPSSCKRARQAAADRLREGEALITLVMAYLFCVVALFALSFLIAVLAFFLVPLTPLAALWGAVLRGGIAVIVFVSVLLPLFVGRVRMAGMIAAGRAVTLAELFHYFTSWRLWWRGVRIALLCPLTLLLPPLFSASALAMGNEEMSLCRVLSLSAGRIPFLVVLSFWGRVLMRFALGLLTLGLLWLLWDVHHTTVTYFALSMQEQAEPDEDIT